MSATPNLRLPYLDANQNQKSVTHNAALRMLDALVNINVQSTALAAPPAAPADGQCWIVASGGTGAWLGKDLDIAAWQDGAWSFYAPNPGTTAYVDAIQAALLWNGTAWVPLLGAIASLALSTLGLGTAADPANPLSARLNAALFSALPTTASPSGTGDVRVKLSKQGTANTASLVLQDGYSGRAEIGIVGGDDLHLKVSPDGSTFYDAMVVAAAGGAVSFLASPTAPTPAAGDSSARLATTAFVAGAVAGQQAGDAVAITGGSITGTTIGSISGNAGNMSGGFTQIRAYGVGDGGANGASQLKLNANGSATGQRASVAFYPTFGNYPGDFGPRRCADFIAGFDTTGKYGGNTSGTWGSEYLALNVGKNGSPNDTESLGSEVLRLTGGNSLNGGPSPMVLPGADGLINLGATDRRWASTFSTIFVAMPLSSAPSTTQQGAIYTDSTLTALRWYNGTQWSRVTNFAKFAAYPASDCYIAAATWTKVNFNTADTNDQGTFTASASRFTAPEAGTYKVGASLAYKQNNASAPTALQLAFYRNGAACGRGRAGATGLVPGVSTVGSSVVLELAAGDSVEAWAFFTGADGYVAAADSCFWADQLP